MAQYKRMDTLLACITATQIFMYIPGDKPKVADISKNQMHFNILSKQDDISKEVFEAGLNVNSFDYALFKTMYLADNQQT